MTANCTDDEYRRHLVSILDAAERESAAIDPTTKGKWASMARQVMEGLLSSTPGRTSGS
jgi:hypothetical protein